MFGFLQLNGIRFPRKHSSASREKCYNSKEFDKLTDTLMQNNIFSTEVTLEQIQILTNTLFKEDSVQKEYILQLLNDRILNNADVSRIPVEKIMLVLVILIIKLYEYYEISGNIEVDKIRDMVKHLF